METPNSFLNVLGDYSGAITAVVDLGLGYLTKNKIDKMSQDLVQQVSELNAQSQERLKKQLETALDDVAKTQVVIEFLEAEKEKKLVADTKKKRILPLIGLGFGVVLLGLVFYKLNKRNG
jgi:hypothetical protein